MGGIGDAITRFAARQRRKALATRLFDAHGGVVAHGPFRGLRLERHANISRGPLGLKICGLYEAGVVDEIAAAAPIGDLVNFGAADGYMALGPLVAGLAQRSICFELTATGREAIAHAAAANGLADRVVLRGAADAGTADALREAGFVPERALVLCDIEGAEFEVLDAGLLAALAPARLIVELHDNPARNGTAAREALIARLPAGSRHRILSAGPVDWRGVPDLAALPDTDRALVMSEGRRFAGEWLVAELGPRPAAG